MKIFFSRSDVERHMTYLVISCILNVHDVFGLKYIILLILVFN
jgi:hypothetical protein